MPVSLSGVRFVVNEMPHGPDHAVLVSLIETAQPGGSFGAAVIVMSCGCPDNIRVMSGSPFLNGV